MFACPIKYGPTKFFKSSASLRATHPHQDLDRVRDFALPQHCGLLLRGEGSRTWLSLVKRTLFALVAFLVAGSVVHQIIAP